MNARRTDQVHPPISAKANRIEDRSNSIIVSFGALDAKRLLTCQSSLVLRKRIPTYGGVEFLYVHAKAPVKSIVGRAEIKRMYFQPVEDLLRRAPEAGMNDDEILKYAGRQQLLGCYELTRITEFRTPLLAAELNLTMKYHPPQSFVNLSNATKQLIDQIVLTEE